MAEMEHKRSISIESQLELIRRRFLESITLVLTILVVLGLPISIARNYYTGMTFTYYVHVTLAAIVLLTYFFRSRINSKLLASCCLLVLVVLSLTGFIQLGLLSAGGYFAMLAIFVATILGYRVGLSIALFCVVAMSVIGYLWHIEFFSIGEQAAHFSIMGNFWLGQIVILSVGSGLFVISARSFFDELNGLMTRIECQKQKIEFLANHDALTGLPTLRLASDRLEYAIKGAKRNNHKVAVLFLDLDGFKPINDNYGHDTGDHVLQVVAQRATGVIREVDTACRIGGDEFLVVLADCLDRDKAQDVSERLIAAITEPMHYAGNELSIGISIGIAMYPDHGSDFRTLKRLADMAMYKAKERSFDKFCFADCKVNPTSQE